MATIRDVAKKAGVSIGSVSRILNNDNSYKTTEETRFKVFEAAKEMNYIISKSKKAKKISIGCLMKYTSIGSIDAYFQKISNGIADHIKDKNYEFNIIQTGSSLDTDLSKFPDGVIIFADLDEGLFNRLKDNGTSIVGVDTTFNSIDNVRYNRFNAGILAMEHLIENGHTNIAYIGAYINKTNLLNIGRYEAYLRVMSKYNQKINENWIIDCHWNHEIAYKETRRLLKNEPRPTALFVGSDHMATAAISAIHSLGLNIPDDISVIGLSNIDGTEYLSPPLTTIAIPQYEMGVIAAELLILRLQGDKSIVKDIYLKCNVLERSSVACIKK